MSTPRRFEELDFRETPLGDLILRRRLMTTLDNLEVYEVILGNAFLMSSLFTTVEIALAELGLEAVDAGDTAETAGLDVVVGGLGLGYTARAALDHPRLRSLRVVEYLAPVIGWHEAGMVPLGRGLSDDPRCRFIHGDFFESALGDFDPGDPGRKYHAVLLDIDHSPANLLHENHGRFYSEDGLRRMSGQLHPGGVFALWSDDPPEESFLGILGEVFATCTSHVVTFHNPHQDRDAASTVYVATKSR